MFDFDSAKTDAMPRIEAGSCLAVANETRADHAKGRFESKSDVMIGSEQIPATGKSFELMRSTLRKRQARTGDKVGHYP